MTSWGDNKQKRLPHVIKKKEQSELLVSNYIRFVVETLVSL